VQGDYLPAQGTFEALSHYFGYVDALADKTGASTPMFDLAASLFCRGIERGMGEYDVAAIKEVIADLPRACGAIKTTR
jgi:3-hydroxyisobutyrate dehydrogenase-like beta-hydroxyacid dehydrogenase